MLICVILATVNCYSTPVERLQYRVDPPGLASVDRPAPPADSAVLRLPSRPKMNMGIPAYD